MAYLEDETCGWPFDEDCYTPPDNGAPDLVQRAKNLTVHTLRTLTLYRVGGCPVTVRPCVQAVCLPGPSPHIGLAGAWINVCECSTGVGCLCGPVESIALPPPVGRIDSVVIDGVVLDPSAYEVHNGYELVRTDGQRWPVRQDMSKPLTEVGTFGVTYLNAHEPDDGAAWAASLLLKEYMKACSDQDCALSPKVRSVARRGISSEIREAVLADGRTGIPLVDAWVLNWNPNLLRQRPKVYSPDLPRVRSTP